MRHARFGLLLTVAAMTGACGGTSITCDEPQVYQASNAGERIVAPEGLSDLQSIKELKIPEPSPQQPRPEGAPCLERPPVYQSPN